MGFCIIAWMERIAAAVAIAISAATLWDDWSNHGTGLRWVVAVMRDLAYHHLNTWF
jgi:hypothetical protein